MHLLGACIANDTKSCNSIDKYLDEKLSILVA